MFWWHIDGSVHDTNATGGIVLPAVKRIHQCYTSLNDYHGHNRLQSLLLDSGFRELIKEHDVSSGAYGIQYSIRPSTYFKLIHKNNYEKLLTVFGADRKNCFSVGLLSLHQLMGNCTSSYIRN